MLIKHKCMANTAIVVAVMLIMLGIMAYAIDSLEQEIENIALIDDIEVNMLTLRRHEKDFLARKNMKYPKKLDATVKILNGTLRDLKEVFSHNKVMVSQLEEFSEGIKVYHRGFTAIVKQYETIGLTPKKGLYGELRSAVHDVESLLGSNDFYLLSSMLQLRRNEKDFMLRLDDKYVQRWIGNAEDFVYNINQSELDTQLKAEIIGKVGVYKQAFINLVEGQKVVGYKPNEGLLGEVRASVHKSEKTLTGLMKTTRAEIDAHKAYLETLSYGGFFLIFIVSVGFAFYLSRDILLGLSRLQENINDIVSTNNLSIKADTSRSDEIGDMAVDFNTMISAFQKLIVDVNQSVVTLNQATDGLSAGIHVTNAGVEQQIQQTELVATAVTEMTTTVENIANTTDETAKKAELTNTNADKGKEGVEKTIARIDQLSNQLLESENVVQALSKDSVTIGTVLGVIQGIAEQTNLLALNAAIEAARAGEQGRGFAVVADEVRTLASRTQDSTQEIESIVSALQTRTNEVVEHMASCRIQGQESAEQASEAGAMLEEITQGVTEIMEMSSAIAVAINEQSTVACEVNKHVIEIKDIAEQSAESARQNEGMSVKLSEQSVKLEDGVKLFVV